MEQIGARAREPCTSFLVSEAALDLYPQATGSSCA